MFKIPSERLEKCRLHLPEFGDFTGLMSGAFQYKNLRIIANSGDVPGSEGWEHVSVSTAIRCPTWSEMCLVKDLFWPEDEAAYQLHPPKSEWVNNHPFCLHMWRNERFPVALPPSIMVGIKKDGPCKNKAEAEAGLLRAKERGDILMLDAKARMIDQMIGKLKKRALELDKDASRLNLANKSEAGLDLKAAVELINSAAARLSK